MRRSVIIVGVVVLLSLTFVIGPSLLFTPSADELAPEEEPDPKMYTPSDSESSFWPYLNAREQHEKRSPLNVIVRGDTETVLHQLQEYGEEDWEETDHDHFDVDEITDELLNTSDDDEDEVVGGDVEEAAEEEQFISPTDVPWSQANGTTRLAYIDPGEGENTY